MEKLSKGELLGMILGFGLGSIIYSFTNTSVGFLGYIFLVGVFTLLGSAIFGEKKSKKDYGEFTFVSNQKCPNCKNDCNYKHDFKCANCDKQFWKSREEFENYRKKHY